MSPESGKLPKDQPVVMQLIRLDPAAAQLHAVVLTYDPIARLPGEVRPGRFLLDSQSRADRPIDLSLPPGCEVTSDPSAYRTCASGTSAAAQSQQRERGLAAMIADYRARKSGVIRALGSAHRGTSADSGQSPSRDHPGRDVHPAPVRRGAGSLDGSIAARPSHPTIWSCPGDRRS